MQLSLIVFCALIATCFSTTLHRDFVNFMDTHDKTYSSDKEFLMRFEIFKNNMQLAAEWSKEGDAEFGVTPFADMTPAEFAENYLMTNLPPYEPKAEFLVHGEATVKANPDKFFWKDQGALTPVKNQGQCGSCWAFSATENLESVYKLAGHSLPVSSPQQVVDCDRTSYGCNGGWPYSAFEYLINFGGQDTEASYPYTAADGACVAKTANIDAKITSYNPIPKDEAQIKTSLVNVSPLSICVDAAKWYLYTGGVLMANQCGTQIDHCVQLTGYDTTAATPYWEVRNSWGATWGESGFLRLQMGANTCAMDDAVTSAVSPKN